MSYKTQSLDSEPTLIQGDPLTDDTCKDPSKEGPTLRIWGDVDFLGHYSTLHGGEFVPSDCVEEKDVLGSQGLCAHSERDSCLLSNQKGLWRVGPAHSLAPVAASGRKPCSDG